MRTGHADRLWLVGGALGAVVLVAVGWFFLISPENGRTTAFNAKTDDARIQLVSLQHRLTDLQRQNDDRDRYQATLNSDRAALPTEADLSGFLRSLQAGDDSHGGVTGVLVGTPVEQAASGTKVYALPVTVTADGDARQLDGLLDQLQRVQPRAVLIKTAHLAGTNSGSLAGASELTLTLQVFVAEPKPSPTATASPKRS